MLSLLFVSPVKGGEMEIDMKTIAFGDNCIDNYVFQKKKYVGGCSVNFSVFVSELGGESSYLGAIGDDENGKLIMDELKRRNVDIKCVQIHHGKTAITNVELVNNDRKFISYDPGVLKKFKLTEKEKKYILSHDYLHTSVYGDVDCYLSEIAGKIKICYDFGNKLDYANIEKVLKYINYAFFSYEKDDEYIREFLKRVSLYGTDCAVATLGENGSIAYVGNKFYKQEINKVKVVDTIGAGDSFIAGFIVEMQKNNDVSMCLKKGAEKAEETIQHFGAI